MAIIAKSTGGLWTTGSTWVGDVAPTAADDVQLDATSGEVTINSGAVCRSLDCTGYVSILTHNASTTLTIGDGTAGASNIALKMVAGMTYTKSSTTTSATSFVSTSATVQTVTLGGKVLGNVTFNGVGGTWTLQDTFNANGAVSTTLTLTQGTLDTNGQTVNLGVFSSSGTLARTLTLGASAINLSRSSATAWDFTTATNLTFNSNTSSITFTGSGADLKGGGKTFNNVTFNGGGTCEISGTNTFNNLTYTGTASTLIVFQFFANQTITGTFTITGDSVINRIFVRTDISGTTRTITAAAVSLTNCDFVDIVAAGASAPWSGTSIGDAQNNTSITFTAAVTRYWVGNGGDWGDTGHWSATSGGASGASVPICHDDVIFDANSISLGSQTIATLTNSHALGKNINFTGVTNNPALSIGDPQNIFGSLTLASGMTTTSSSFIVFRSRSNATLTTNGVSISFAITIICPNTTFTIGDNFTSTDNLTFTGGSVASTLDANNKNLTLDLFSSSNSNPRTITMGSGTWTVNGTGTVWTLATSTNLTLNVNTSTIEVSDTSSTAKTFTGGGKTYNNITFSGDNITVSGANAFATMAVNNAGLATGLKLTSVQTQTVTNFTTNGSAGNLAKLVSTTSGSRHTLSKASGTITVDYMSIQDSGATGGATWRANNSTNVSNNTGWIFEVLPSVSDSITVTDTPALLLPELPINVSDSITITENVEGGFISPNVSDSITITDTPSLLIPSLFSSVSEAITVTDTPTVFSQVLYIETSEAITVTDTPEIQGITVILDSVTVTESIVMNLDIPNLNVSDSITVTDTESTHLWYFPSSTNWAKSSTNSTDWEEQPE